MTEPINLNRARKDRARQERRAKADANAAKHGRTKAQRAVDQANNNRAKQHLDTHRTNTRAPSSSGKGDGGEG